LTGSFISGLWTAFIGWFLESTAGSQLQMEVLKSVLGDHKVYDAMKRDFPQVSGDTSLQTLVDKLVLPGTGRYFRGEYAKRVRWFSDAGFYSQSPTVGLADHQCRPNHGPTPKSGFHAARCSVMGRAGEVGSRGRKSIARYRR
jgi:hypothetical protein